MRSQIQNAACLSEALNAATKQSKTFGKGIGNFPVGYFSAQEGFGLFVSMCALF